MRKTLWDERARAELIERVTRLSPEQPALWGRMSAGEMVAHCVEGIRLAYGEIVATKRRSTPFRYWPLKYLFVYLLPLPRGAPAPLELVTRGKTCEWESSIGRLRDGIAAFPVAKPAAWGEHHIFGRLSARAWGALGYRHIDHHLRQFGV
jgi:hypothetical protein